MAVTDFLNNMFTTPEKFERATPGDKPKDDKPGKQTENKRGYHYDPTHVPKDFYSLFPAWGNKIEPLMKHVPKRKAKFKLADEPGTFNSQLEAEALPIMWQRPALPLAPKHGAFRLEGGHEDEKAGRAVNDFVSWLRARNISWVNVLAAPVVVVNKRGGWQEVPGDVVVTWRSHPEHSRPVRVVTILLSTNQAPADLRRTYLAMAFRALLIEIEGVYGKGTVHDWIAGMFGGQHPMLEDEDGDAAEQLEQRFASYVEMAQSGAVYVDNEQTGPHLLAFHAALDGTMGQTIWHGTDWFKPAPMFAMKQAA